MIVVDIPIVGGKMIIHMAIYITIYMITLVGIFLNVSMFHVARFLSLMVHMHYYVSCTFFPFQNC